MDVSSCNCLWKCIYTKTIEISFKFNKAVELFEQAGAPKGLVNVVNGDKEVVDALIENKYVSSISFVGSSKVASTFMRNLLLLIRESKLAVRRIEGYNARCRYRTSIRAMSSTDQLREVYGNFSSRSCWQCRSINRKYSPKNNIKAGPTMI